MDYLKFRTEMVGGLSSLGIKNARVLDAMLNVPRHRFMDSAYALRAYENQAWTIGYRQTISQPYIVARMTELLLQASNRGRVLELGTGSGYQAAVLSRLFDQVYTIERIGELYQRTKEFFDTEPEYANIYTCFGDGTLGWPEERYHPFDAIICTAAAKGASPQLFAQLADSGVLVMPIGEDAQSQYLHCFYKESGKIVEKSFEQVSFVPVLTGTSRS